jgi:hypothetical protein
LGGEFESSKYGIYSSGSNSPSALNSGKIHHFRMDTISVHPETASFSRLEIDAIHAMECPASGIPWRGAGTRF